MRRGRLLALAIATLSPAAFAQAPSENFLPRYWQQSGPDRWFAAAALEAGVPYYRTGVTLGYGRPHWRWAGLWGWSQLSPSGPASYLGLRGVLPNLELRAGGRYVVSANQHFLPREDSYQRTDLEVATTGRSRYLSGEAELVARVELAYGSFFAVASGYYLAGVPAGELLFEETLKVVALPPWLFRARGGYLFHVTGVASPLKVGLTGEIIGVPGRSASVARVGPALSVSITDHLEATGTLLVVVSSPDNLGLAGADFGQIGLRYRWATGDRFARFP